MKEHGFAADGMKDFGGFGFHPGAFACGEDHNADGHGVASFWVKFNKIGG
jgi:hypothetical protein